MCTWAGCDKDGGTPQLGRNGQEWARLCDEHAKELDADASSGVPKRIMRAWVKAQGGAKAAAERTSRCLGPIAAALVSKTGD